MVSYATSRGAHVRTHSPIVRITPERRGVRVHWREASNGGGTHDALFDEVVLTTDMRANREFLDHLMYRHLRQIALGSRTEQRRARGEARAEHQG
jgi:hypothetical protein